jgi:hypothetical protein
MAELENLEQEELDEKMLAVGPTPAAKLPDVPLDSLQPEQIAKKGKKIFLSSQKSIAQFFRF